jgi:hypothetical protein
VRVIALKIIALKSSLVNPTEASFPGTMEIVARCCRALYQWSVMKSLFLCLLMMSILMASFYSPRAPLLRRLINR